MNGPAWYARLLRLLPPHFRERHGAELEAAFQERIQGAGSMRGRVAVRAGATRDILYESVRQRLWKRARRRGGLLDPLTSDLRFGARGLIRNPLFSTVAVLTLALGVGVNVTIFSLANEILLRPLPIPASHELVDVVPDIPGGNSFVGFSLSDYQEYRSANQTLSSVAATTGITLEHDASRRSVRGSAVSADYFDVMGLVPAVGSGFTEDQAESPGGALRVLVSDGFWRESLGGRRDVVGAEIGFNGLDFVVVGIMPAGFKGRHIGFPIDVWVPLRVMETLRAGMDLDDREEKPLELVGRMRAGLDVGAVRGDLVRIAADLEQRHPETNRGAGVAVHPFTGVDYSLRRGVKGFLGLLFLLAAMVLLIACLNVGSMLLSRASARSGELAVRAAIGASRRRVVFQLLVETVLLFAVSGVVAVFVAFGLNHAVGSWIDLLPVPLGFDLSLDRRVLAFALALALLSSLVAGAVPARGVSGVSPASALGGRGSAGTLSSARFRSALVVAQVAVSVMLLGAAGAFLQSFRRGQTRDLGLDVSRLAVIGVGLPRSGTDMEAARAAGESIVERLESVPGVADVALADAPPVGVGRSPAVVDIPGRTPPPDQEGFVFDRFSVSIDYGEAVGLTLLRGRGFQIGDEGAPVALVNRAAAERFWPEANPVGSQIVMDGRSHSVVGVVENTRAVIQDPVSSPRVYRTLQVAPGSRVTVVIRLVQPLTGPVARDLEAAVEALMPDGSPGGVRGLDDVVSFALLPQQTASRVTGVLGILGLLLATVGLYGVVAYGVGRRRREFGIRMSLGEEPGGIFLLVVGAGFRLVGLGLCVGLLGVVAAFPIMRALLEGLVVKDLFGLIVLLPAMLVSGFVAAGAPALRAVTIDPARALRP